MKLANADEVVFVSEWLRSIYVNLGMSKNKTKVIMSGSNKNIFKDYQNKLNNNKTNIVTHHWSSHKNKGFDSYMFLDKLIKSSKWSNKLEFTYIGNASTEYSLKNSNIVEPISGIDLAQN